MPAAGLPVARIPEPRMVALMRNDVIDNRCADDTATDGLTSDADRMFREVGEARTLPPNGVATVPGGPSAGLMLLALRPEEMMDRRPIRHVCSGNEEAGQLAPARPGTPGAAGSVWLR